MTFPTGNETRYPGKYAHCPDDVRDAIDKYERDVKEGRIKFTKESVMAIDYPGELKSDEALGDFASRKVVSYD